MNQDQLGSKPAFKYTDFTKDADKYLLELEPKITVVQQICNNFLKPQSSKRRRFTRFDLDFVEALRELRKNYLPYCKRFVAEQVRTSVFFKAVYMDTEDIKSDKLRTKIINFRKLDRARQEELIEEAFG